MQLVKLQPEDCVEAYQLIKMVYRHYSLRIQAYLDEASFDDLIIYTMKKKYYRYGYNHGIAIRDKGEMVAVAYAYPGLNEPFIDHPLMVSCYEKGLDIPDRAIIATQREALDDEYYLDVLVTKSGFEGRGYGTRLLKELIQIGKGINYKKITLNCEKENTRAYALYQHLGFRSCQEIMVAGKPHYHMCYDC